MDEIEHAQRVVSRIPSELRESSIILGTPPTEQLRTLGQETSDKVTERDAEAWLQCGEHRLLMKLIANGVIPEGRLDGRTQPHSHHFAFRIAAERGYDVPPHFYDTPRSYNTEEEAWYALQNMLSGSPGIWKWTASFGHREMFSSVAQVRAQFIVPDAFYDDKTPYIVDQLWIVRVGSRKVRLICLEIDGPGHLREDRQKAKARDLKLTSLGYEVYHVAGWWCQVDAYRVICEFVSKAGIFPRALEGLIGSELRRIEDYICDKCGKPMIRRDDNWIQELNEGRSLAHRVCANAED